MNSLNKTSLVSLIVFEASLIFGGVSDITLVVRESHLTTKGWEVAFEILVFLNGILTLIAYILGIVATLGTNSQMSLMFNLLIICQKYFLIYDK